MNSLITKLLILAAGFAIGAYISPKIMPPPNSTAQNSIISGNEANYALEIASFPDIESALGLLDTLATRGYFAYIQAGEGRYLVRVGAWASKEQAREFQKGFEAKMEMKATPVEIEAR